MSPIFPRTCKSNWLARQAWASAIGAAIPLMVTSAWAQEDGKPKDGDTTTAKPSQEEPKQPSAAAPRAGAGADSPKTEAGQEVREAPSKQVDGGAAGSNVADDGQAGQAADASEGRDEKGARPPSRAGATEGTAPAAAEPSSAQQGDSTALSEPAPDSAAPEPEDAPDDAAADDAERADEGDAELLPQNDVGGHLVVGVGGGVAVPFGELSSGVPFAEVAEVGGGALIDAGYGFGRDVVLGAYGEFQGFSNGSGCPGCAPTSLGVGLFVRYHLVQGLRFDPWAAYGIGFRSVSVGQSNDGAATRDYAGLEWLRLSFGGDWYPTSNFGFGPFVQFGAASMFDRPNDEVDGGVNWRWQLGMRLVLDVPGK